MDQSFRVKPFRFDTEFAIEPPPAEENREPMAESLEVAALRAAMEALRADHARALAAARDEAFLEGLAQARAEREQALLAAFDALHAEWEDFADRRDAMLDRLGDEACLLARAIGETLAARALDEAPVEAVDQAIGRILTQIARGQEVVVTVHPDLVGATEARIAARQAQDRRRLNLVVQADERLAPGDARLSWDGGRLSLDAAERARAVAAELEALGVGEATASTGTAPPGPDDSTAAAPPVGGPAPASASASASASAPDAPQA